MTVRESLTVLMYELSSTDEAFESNIQLNLSPLMSLTWLET